MTKSKLLHWLEIELTSIQDNELHNELFNLINDLKRQQDVFPIMWIGIEHVKDYVTEEYEVSDDILRQIARNLADRWESDYDYETCDYDYETFMEDGVQEEIDIMIANGREGIKKID